MEDRIINNVKKLMERQHPDIKDYSVMEYKSCYAVTSPKLQPILFEKELGIPMFKTFTSIPSAERANGKCIYTNGGKDNAKK